MLECSADVQSTEILGVFVQWNISLIDRKIFTNKLSSNIPTLLMLTQMSRGKQVLRDGGGVKCFDAQKWEETIKLTKLF